MSEKRMNDELAAVEAILGSLTPSPSSAGRDRLMFLAGRASADRIPLLRRHRLATWFWPCATSLSLLTAATFSILWAVGSKPEVVERMVYVAPKDSPATFDFTSVVVSPPSPWENRRMCQLVLEKGVDALPQLYVPTARTAPVTPRRDSYRDLVNELLHESSI